MSAIWRNIAAARDVGSAVMGAAMYVGTQIEPRDDTDFQVWAQLGVTHVCVDPPGSPHHWSLAISLMIA